MQKFSMMNHRVLTGINVPDDSEHISWPYGAKMPTSFGAKVIKTETILFPKDVDNE